MITVISGTNRPRSYTRKIAALVEEVLVEVGEEVTMVDLTLLPDEIFANTSYASKPESFTPFQRAVVETDGLLTVVPEYNGSFPGILKYYIDMLRFPQSLYEMPAAFIGISSGRWSGVRAVEQLEMVFQHRHAHLFGRRCFIPHVKSILDQSGHLTDAAIAERLHMTVADFVRFCAKLRSDTE